jgi:D-glycero-alpha-D-manno-heptose 1-phosphate guanylyltransferase
MSIVNRLSIKPILLLAGGFGSRLKSVVPNVPKPLAPVDGKPFLMYLIENLVSQGAQEFILLLHYRAELIEASIAELKRKKNMSSVKITCIIEEIPLGTGGSIINAIDQLKLNESFLVINADTWLSGGLQMVNFSTTNTIAGVKVKDFTRYGSMIKKGKKIIKFIEKDLSAGNGLINAGLYHLDPHIFKGFDKNSFISLENDIFPILVSQGELNVLEVQADFIDIGIPEDYFKFSNWVKSGKVNEL